MKNIKVIISVLVLVPALMIFAGEAPAQMFPIQLAAGAVLGMGIAMLIKRSEYEN